MIFQSKYATNFTLIKKFFILSHLNYSNLQKTCYTKWFVIAFSHVCMQLCLIGAIYWRTCYLTILSMHLLFRLDCEWTCTQHLHACALSLSLCSAPHCARARPLISRDDRWPWWPQASWYCQMLRARLNSPA